MSRSNKRILTYGSKVVFTEVVLSEKKNKIKIQINFKVTGYGVQKYSIP